MQTLLIAVGAFVGYLIAYHTYGRWLARKVFNLDRNAAVPSVALNDDTDFVPTSRGVVFGHHFTSIAGTGPIVGPAIAIMWGWVPALLWVLLGSVFIGAVHDFGALVVSLRNRGQTVGDIAGRVVNPRVRILFLTILLFGLWVVLAIFGLVIASVFKEFPESILPVWLQVPIAVAIGLWLHRKGAHLLLPSAIALGLMYLTVWFGASCPGTTWEGGVGGEWVREFNNTLKDWPLWLWTAVLLAYCYAASVMPVWILLQPRDYINSLQLISSLGLIVAAIAVVGIVGVDGAPLEIVAPAVDWNPVNAPPMWPVLFITIACGAISGFHCLVSSGTSSKQLKCETDAQFVGYGSMLTEGFLAVLVILAVSAGIGLGWPSRFGELRGAELWGTVYADWKAAGGLQTTIGAFVVGCANFLEQIGVDRTMAKAIMGVLVASFAGTTLDTATRLQRYVVQELSGAMGDALPALRPVMQPLRNPHGATLFAVVTALLLAMFPGVGQPWTAATIGQGGKLLWPLFGATNQLLAGLAFLVVTFWLWRRQKPVWFVAIPTVFMLIMPAWALVVQLFGAGGWWEQRSYLLTFVGLATLALEAWMIVEAALMWPRVRGVLEESLPPLPTRTVAAPAREAATMAGSNA
jgi:carbon starvation protein